MSYNTPYPKTTSLERSETLAVLAFQFLVEDPVRLSDFCKVSGIDPKALTRETLETRSFLTGVLEYVSHNESLLLTFCAHKSIDPTEVQPALTFLSGVIDTSQDFE